MTEPPKRSRALAPIYANARIFKPHGDNEQHISDIIYPILSNVDRFPKRFDGALSYIYERNSCHQFMSLIFD